MNDLEMNKNGEGVKKRNDFLTITESEDPVVVAWVVRALKLSHSVDRFPLRPVD